MTDTDGPGCSLLDRINDDRVWEAYIARKESFDPYDPDIARFDRMRLDPECRAVCEAVSRGEHRFSVPKKKLIAKNRTGKKRTVYQLEENEMMALRIVADQLCSYDGLFSPDLYSFRRNVHAGDAARRLFGTPGLESKWGFKADVHDYFNSIDVGRLLPELKKDLSDDRLYAMFESILSEPKVVFRGEEVEERKGVMAGIPVSAFLANYYLKDVDSYFGSLGCTYMRYADDILILADSEEEMLRYRDVLTGMIESRGLEMNPDKEVFFRPGQPFEFLGFRISAAGIDISGNSVRKMKGRIRRSARSIRRWMLRKDAPVGGTIKALIREYNRRFYGYESGELSWSAWYFSAITTTDSLHEIDRYFQDWIRYVATGRHNKRNYDEVPYEMMRDRGYRPLVSEYYNHRKQAQT